MAKKRRRHDEEAWENAKKASRLNARQVEMARALDLNPKKLPGLRPSPEQRWKLPVGEFIEECYWKRFGGNTQHNQPREAKPGSRKRSTPREDAQLPGAVHNPKWQAESLIELLGRQTREVVVMWRSGRRLERPRCADWNPRTVTPCCPPRPRDRAAMTATAP